MKPKRKVEELRPGMVKSIRIHWPSTIRAFWILNIIGSLRILIKLPSPVYRTTFYTKSDFEHPKDNHDYYTPQ